MPSTIPYDHPSLILGNIVDTKVLSNLQKIASLQNHIDAAHDKLNSQIALKRSLTMTLNELVGMGVKTNGINDKIENLNTSIIVAANNYLKIRLKNEDEILAIREDISTIEISESLESPIDFGKSEIKNLPLSSESLKLDAQYFSFENQDEEQTDILKNIENFVKESTDNLSGKSGKIAKTASSQVYRQQQNNNLSGTLIITASCTHKNVAIIDPLVIDPDKAIDTWNTLKKDTLTGDKKTIRSIELKGDKANQESMSLVTGVSYGSSFVGMVHLLKNTSNSINPSEAELKNLQEKIKISGWLQNETGNFNGDNAMTRDVKRFLNNQSVSAHVSLIVMGTVPSIASNKLSSFIGDVSNSQKNKLKSEIKLLNDASEKQLETIETGNEKNKARNNVLQQLSLKEEAIIKGLGKLDSNENKVMDINSLMTAFENYLTAIKNEKCLGAPLNFYLKKIKPSQIAKLWINKYYPQNTEETKKSNK